MSSARVAGVVLCLCLSCKKAPPAGPPPGPAAPAPIEARGWAIHVQNGAATFDQRRDPDGGCVLTCALDGKPSTWSSTECLLHDDDFTFVSRDCAEALGVLREPASAETWDKAVVMVKYEKGSPAPVIGAELTVRAADVKQTDGHFDWLAGVAGSLGATPQYLPGNDGVLVTPRKGRAMNISFSGSVVQKAAPTASADGDALYQWVTDDGSTEFAQGLSNVPARHRGHAKRVAGGGISVVAGTHAGPRVPYGNPNTFGTVPRVDTVALRNLFGRGEPPADPNAEPREFGFETFAQKATRMAQNADRLRGATSGTFDSAPIDNRPVYQPRPGDPAIEPASGGSCRGAGSGCIFSRECCSGACSNRQCQ